MFCIMDGFQKKKRAFSRLNDTLCRNIPLSLHFFIKILLLELNSHQSHSVITKKYILFLAENNFFSTLKSKSKTLLFIDHEIGRHPKYINKK